MRKRGEGYGESEEGVRRRKKRSIRSRGGGI
jgi:hypothetical protein